MVWYLLCNKFPTHCFLFLNTVALLYFKGQGNVSQFFWKHSTIINLLCVLQSFYGLHGHSSPLWCTVPWIFTIPSLLFVNKQNPKIPCYILILHLATLQVSYKSQVLSYHALAELKSMEMWPLCARNPFSSGGFVKPEIPASHS